MVAEDPEVAGLGDRILGRLGDILIGFVRPSLATGDRQQSFQLGGVEAAQVEIEGSFLSHASSCASSSSLHPACSASWLSAIR
jgi:hypothetical protein